MLTDPTWPSSPTRSKWTAMFRRSTRVIDRLFDCRSAEDMEGGTKANLKVSWQKDNQRVVNVDISFHHFRELMGCRKSCWRGKEASFGSIGVVSESFSSRNVEAFCSGCLLDVSSGTARSGGIRTARKHITGFRVSCATCSCWVFGTWSSERKGPCLPFHPLPVSESECIQLLPHE